MKKHYREPVTHTCPDIDKAIKQIEAVRKLCNLTGREDEKDLKDIIDDINRELWDTDDLLEKLRKSNDELRSWGITEAEEVDVLNELLEQYIAVKPSQ